MISNQTKDRACVSNECNERLALCLMASLRSSNAAGGAAQRPERAHRADGRALRAWAVEGGLRRKKLAVANVHLCRVWSESRCKKPKGRLRRQIFACFSLPCPRLSQSTCRTGFWWLQRIFSPPFSAGRGCCCFSCVLFPRAY